MNTITALVIACVPAVSPTGDAFEVVDGFPVPEVRPDGTVIFRVAGHYMESLDQARESAIRVARERMSWWLEEQDPPIRKIPSLDQVRSMVLHEEAPLEAVIVGNEKRFKARVTFALRSEQVRSLRGTDRTFAGLWVMGGALALLTTIFGALRLNEWSRGYLSGWLVPGVIGVGIVLGGIWWWAR